MVRLHARLAYWITRSSAGPSSASGTRAWVIVPTVGAVIAGATAWRASCHGHAGASDPWSMSAATAPSPATSHRPTIGGSVTRHVALATSAPATEAGHVAATAIPRRSTETAFAWSRLFA